jgi:hypothetical protein
MKGHTGLLIVLLILAVAAAILFIPPFKFTGFFISTTGENASLALWDNTDAEGGSYKVYAQGSWLGTTTARFFANYTNKTSGEAINGTGIVCNITFNLSGSWSTPESMWFNSSSKLYNYNTTFVSRGLYLWNATCYGSAQGFDDLNAGDNITVTNTRADIYSPLDNKTCYEDTSCNHAFDLDCYDVDDIDENNLTYGYIAGTEFPGFSLNEATGAITVSITTDSACGVFKVSLAVQDSTGSGATDNKTFMVNAVNDKPVLGSVPTSSDQNTTLNYDINASDEETPSGPFFFNITFIACYRPFNNEHMNLTNCSGLLSINSTTGMVNKSGILQNLDVGNYTINFTVTDSGDNLTDTSIPPYTWLANQTGSTTLNFTVVDINDRPVISPVADQFWAQNQSVLLVINASDIDNGTLVFNATTFYRNLSSYVNTSLFPISLNQTLYLDNGTSLGNATMNFTPVLNGQVGNYTVNFSVYDGRENGTYAVLVNFTVLNINDPPVLNFSCRNYSVQEMPYACNVGQNTTDPDNFPAYVPYTDTVNGTLTFNLSFTNCSKVNASDTNCTIFSINEATGMINYTSPLRKDAGNYTLNVSVTDGGNLTVSTSFNFSVIADYAPNITTTVPQQSTAQNQSFYLQINATDEDNATDTLIFRSETYYNATLLNTTLFPIQNDQDLWPPGPLMGVMNYTHVNNSQVGNYTVRVIVNDTWGREDDVVFNITVYNLNDPPVLNFSCANYTYETTYYQESRHECNVGENTTDLDQQTPYGDNLTYSLSFINGSALFIINSTTGIINFSAENDSWANSSLNFTYVVNLSVNDSGGLADSQVINITVYAVNDPPVFNFTNASVYANSTYFENISAEMADEENSPPFFFNVTFVNCTKQNVSDTNCSLFEMNHSTGVINFYAQEKDIGNYTLNVTIKDSGNYTQPYNATGWKLIYFRLLSLNHPPNVQISGVIPSNYFYENDSVLFAIGITDADGDPVNCAWYRNSTYITTVSNCHATNSWTYTPGFEESGVWMIKVEATDSKSVVSDDWPVTISNTNRPPQLVYPIQNQTWNMNTVNRNIVLSYNIRDPDNENNVTNDDNNITINFTGPTHVAVLIDGEVPPINITPANWTGKAVVTLTPQTDWHGMDTIVFAANDSQYNVMSNNITLNISYTETQTQTIVQQLGGGGGGGGATGTKIASLSITVSQMRRVTSYNNTYANVTFSNTGQVPLNGIHVTSYVNETEEIVTTVSRNYISQLNTGESLNVTLGITTYNLQHDSYEIKVTGGVTEPRFNQSTTIYIRPVFNETKLEEKIQLAKDLFEDNPECLDLMELIIQAENELGENRVEEAQELTEAALDNCRDIIRYANTTKRKVTPESEKIPVNEIVITFLVIALIAILAYMWLEMRAMRTKVKKP